MSISFKLAKIPQIIFGPGQISKLNEEILQFGKNVLIITGSKSISKWNKSDLLNKSLKSSGISVQYVSVSHEPSPGLVDEICETYKNKRIDVIVGIGGGSVLDAGKAVSAMMGMNTPVKDFLEGVGTKKHPGIKIPYIAIPTTSGTGSETTSNAVLSEIGENGFKKSLRHPNFVPDIAIVDPELTISCSKELTGAAGMDAFTQLFESYLSVKASPMTDTLAYDGLKHIISNLKKTYNTGSDINARSSLAYASMLSGVTLTNAGLGTVHGFASAIGGYFNIPHGVVCGTLMASCNEYTVRKLRKDVLSNPFLLKYAETGRLFSKEQNKTSDFYIDFLLESLKELTDYFSIPKLSDFGIKESDFDKIIAHTDNKSNPAVLSDVEMKEILKSRL